MRFARLLFVNAFACAVLQMGIAWLFERWDVRRFSVDRRAFQPHDREIDFYRMLGIRRWKRLLPDGAPWVGGSFSKARLAQRDEAYLRRFAAESYRGELAHLFMIACMPIVFVWNPLRTWPVFCLYALAANLPCILTQRYNRAMLLRILEKKNVALSDSLPRGCGQGSRPRS